jgi:hypothetical protein
MISSVQFEFKVEFGKQQNTTSYDIPYPVLTMVIILTRQVDNLTNQIN